MTRTLTLCALTFLATTSAGSIAKAAEQAGVLAAIKSPVEITRERKTIKGKSGTAIFEGDRISGSGTAPFQMMMMDETVFTLSGKPEITLDTYEYSEDTQDGRLQITNHAGALKFASGHISSGDPDDFVIKAQDSTIGVRGTVGLISVLTPDQANQQFPSQNNPAPSDSRQPVVFAALTGPGPLAQSGSSAGSFTFSSPNGSVDLNRPGGAVLATPGQPPVFFIAPPGAIQNLSQGINGNTSNTNETEDNSNTPPPETNTPDTNPGDLNLANLGMNTGNLVDPASINTDTIISTNNTPSFGGTLQELVAVNSGTVSGGGSYSGTITGDFDYLINFANRTFDMQSYNLNGGTLDNDSIDVVGGSAALPVDGRTSLTVGNNGEDFAATVSGGCAACSVTATFPTDSSISATVTNGASRGSTGQIGF